MKHRTHPKENDHGGTSTASSTRPSSTSTGSATDDQDLQSPNASPCLPPPSPPGTPPTSVQLSTTVYQHINLHRRYDVTNTTTPPPGQLRPLTAAQTDAFCTDAGSTPGRRQPSSDVPRFVPRIIGKHLRISLPDTRQLGGEPGSTVRTGSRCLCGAGPHESPRLSSSLGGGLGSARLLGRPDPAR